MAFSSVGFLFLFLPVFLLAQTLLPWRNVTYVLLSLLFYFIGESYYTIIVVLSVTLNYCFGLWIDASVGSRRRLAVSVSVGANLAVLFIFKYFGFFAQNVIGLPNAGWTAALPLPLGISFFTFHAISYLVDIYRREARAERSFVNLALYILMFPQLIAGPILRFHTIARQLRRRVVTVRHVYHGFVLFGLGLGQKVLIADTLAGVCDPLFAHWQSLDTAGAWLAAISYTLQIYFDFGGYSNMAIGLGLASGFLLPRNFDYPYISMSITEFWRRWHMSLSRWFRDYLYIPLGGNRHGPLRTYANLVIVFLLCGLWHGAAWTFVLWGVFHGALLVVERLGLEPLLRRCPRLMRHVYALLAIIVGWVLFRAETVGQAWSIMTKMFVFTRSDELDVWQTLTGEEIAVLVAGVVLSTPLLARVLSGAIALPRLPPWRPAVPAIGYAFGTAGAVAVILGASLKILSGAYSPFIYFRF
jgi:alginate O-acetyltransferase complex protein AlgI